MVELSPTLTAGAEVVARLTKAKILTATKEGLVVIDLGKLKKFLEFLEMIDKVVVRAVEDDLRHRCYPDLKSVV